MKLKSHISSTDGRIVYHIDDDNDRYESFGKIVDYFKRKNIKIIEYHPGGWGSSFIRFYLDEIDIEVIFDDFGGTDLTVNPDISSDDLKKVDLWVQEVYAEVHKDDVKE